LEEVDSWGGRSVGVAVEFLMGGSGGRPRCVCGLYIPVYVRT